MPANQENKGSRDSAAQHRHPPSAQPHAPRQSLSRFPAAGTARSGGAGELQGDLDEQHFVIRKAFFGTLVAVLIGVALYFVATMKTVENGRPDALKLTGNTARAFTIKAFEGPRQRVQELLARRDVKALAAPRELFMVDIAGGKAVLCVGTFSSRDTAQALLPKVSAHPEFRKAVIAALRSPERK